MNRIDQTFGNLKKQGKKAFVAYITAGDPTLDISKRLMQQMQDCGVNLLELGIPFSDPLADGAVNQKAAERALKAGTSVKKIMAAIRDLRKTSQIPVILFTYLNPILKYGLESFSIDARKSGVDGVLILDMPPEEGGEVGQLFQKQNIHLIYLIAPTSTPERIKTITEHTAGFIYYVSRMGVTGVQDKIQENIPDRVNLIQQRTSLPIVVGFGISKPDHVKQISRIADGVVVGSAIVQKIDHHQNDSDIVETVSKFIRQLTHGLDL